ncbi:hypothetical protein BDN70DRAFT_929466 [Pholiota conissans]|uniref:Uncharacterized protein n=1 Tax=Pholiota conissans TaxID=109636 RepID=A0A9P5Z8Z7_9AGAR|nr:hypothetical protein BDN70DRAFT_929466 [Pholiota conissans]
MSPDRKQRVPRRIRHIPPERLANSFHRLPRPSPESPSLHSRHAGLNRPDDRPDSRSAQDHSAGDIPDSHNVDRLPRPGSAPPSTVCSQRAVQENPCVNSEESLDRYIPDHMRSRPPLVRNLDDYDRRPTRELFNESTHHTHLGNTTNLQDTHKGLPFNLHTPSFSSVSLQEYNTLASESCPQHTSCNTRAAYNDGANLTFFPSVNQEGSWGANQFAFTLLPTPVNTHYTSRYQYQNDPLQQDGYPDPSVLFDDPPTINSTFTATDYYDRQ